MLCCFSRSCFKQTENNISYDNKQNKYMTTSNNPGCQSVMSPPPPHFECQSLGTSVTAFLWMYRLLRPFTFDSTKQRERRGVQGGLGGIGFRGWWTLCRFCLCMFSARCPSCKKNGNVLVVYSCRPSATVAKSSNVFYF